MPDNGGYGIAVHRSFSSQIKKLGHRRLILDMHIGDWDDGFLAKIDPVAIAEASAEANLSSFMLYAHSHVGLCNWPTDIGTRHANLQERDLVGEMLHELRKRDLAVVGYMSAIFDNQAFLKHPDWRIEPVTQGEQKSDKLFSGSRYGLVCPNNPDYRSYITSLATELYSNYEFDCAFFDMLFWTDICQCQHCRKRLKNEEGLEFPTTMNWLDGDWSRFVKAREHWLAEFTQLLSDTVKAACPDIPVYHNFAGLPHNWRWGLSLKGAMANDFMGGDFYVDAAGQLLLCKLFNGLSQHKPMEFMTTRCPTPGNHELVKSSEHMLQQVQAATLFNAAFMWIDAINPDGTINPPVYSRIGEVFKQVEAYEDCLGGESAAEVAIYFSDNSKMDFAENGKPIQEAAHARTFPHLKAARGLSGVLQRNHIPFDVITANDLERLSDYRLVLLPNVLRMDQQEVDALRRFVKAGGNLYASRYTSWTNTGGKRFDDFQLADLFGCHAEADDLGPVTYLKPQDDNIENVIAPQRYLDHFAAPGSPGDGAGTIRLKPQAEGKALASLNLPFAREWGDMFNLQWASIHSSPPWQDTDTPVIVENSYGKGRVIYSAADIETIPAGANEALLKHLLVDRLLDDGVFFTCDAHPSVWSEVYHHPEDGHYRICLLNHQEQLPAIPVEKISFKLCPVKGEAFTGLAIGPQKEAHPYSVDEHGCLTATLERLTNLTMLHVTYNKKSMSDKRSIQLEQLLTFSTLGCPDCSLGQVCDLAEAHGIRQLDLRFLEGCTDLPAYVARCFSCPEELVDYLRMRGMKVQVLNTSFSLLNHRQEDREEFLRFAELADRLEVPYLRVFDGGSGVDPGNEELESAVDSILWWRALKAEFEFDVDIAVETHTALVKSDSVLRLQKRLNTPVKLVWDSFHTWCEGGEELSDTWMQLKPFVVHVHVKDGAPLQRPSTEPNYSLPGEGFFPLKELFSMLCRDEYSGGISLEWERAWHRYLPDLEAALPEFIKLVNTHWMRNEA
jgi:sugar phosphate isomerase/epimerase